MQGITFILTGVTAPTGGGTKAIGGIGGGGHATVGGD
jgi:hypothetical protein